MGDKNTFWSSASKDGLMLGGVSVAYVLIVFLMDFIPGGTVVNIVKNLLSPLLWAVKLWASLYLLRLFVRSWQPEEENAGSQSPFRYGAAVAFLSALVYSGFYFAYVSFITPDIFMESISVMEQSGMMDANSLKMMQDMAPSMPLYSFVGNLIYCSLFGIIASSFYARPKQNPFN